MVDVRPADDVDFASYYGATQVKGRWIGRAVWRGRRIAGFGGLIEVKDGEWFAFLELPAPERRPSIYRHILTAFQEAREQGATVIKATCDMRIPKAEALMDRLGFKPTDEAVDGKVIWQWN